MGKNAKEHRRKVQLRNDKVKQDKERIQKLQKNYIMNLINQEKENGLFENIPTINPINTPNSDVIIEGPSI